MLFRSIVALKAIVPRSLSATVLTLVIIAARADHASRILRRISWNFLEWNTKIIGFRAHDSTPSPLPPIFCRREAPGLDREARSALTYLPVCILKIGLERQTFRFYFPT